MPIMLGRETRTAAFAVPHFAHPSKSNIFKTVEMHTGSIMPPSQDNFAFSKLAIRARSLSNRYDARHDVKSSTTAFPDTRPPPTNLRLRYSQGCNVQIDTK